MPFVFVKWDKVVIFAAHKFQFVWLMNKKYQSAFMKKIFDCILIALIGIVVPLASCSKDEPKDDRGEYNGHEYVDLGLPCGVKWATCNVGATLPSDFGDYFAWGETQPKETYASNNSKFYNVGYPELKGMGVIDSDGNLTAKYDVATIEWGGKWRMPTKEELIELRNQCTWIPTTLNDVKGYQVTGPNGNSIFLPSAGYYNHTENDAGSHGLINVDSHGYYWSSTLYSGGASAWGLDFPFYSPNEIGSFHRYFGFTVRPVME